MNSNMVNPEKLVYLQLVYHFAVPSKYISVLDQCSNLKIDYHKTSHRWYTWDFYQVNQLENKLNKKSTQTFRFGLKFWPQLKIIETEFFSNKLSLG